MNYVQIKRVSVDHGGYAGIILNKSLIFDTLCFYSSINYTHIRIKNNIILIS